MAANFYAEIFCCSEEDGDSVFFLGHFWLDTGHIVVPYWTVPTAYWTFSGTFLDNRGSLSFFRTFNTGFWTYWGTYWTVPTVYWTFFGAFWTTEALYLF